ncbi:hypothetical protein ACH5RR_009568 [Cinchona calisaya]|uniref:Uncharacterized protein n=1 Tax=Cinchona calisaya TaxID=153742 RepID=A0ABD3AGY0_9GENT
MGRACHISRREGQRCRSSAHEWPHFLVSSANPSSPPAMAAASPPTLGGGGGPEPAPAGGDSTQPISAPSSQEDQVSASASGSSPDANQHGPLYSRQDRAGPSDFQTFSESQKSRFSAISMSSTQDLGSEVRRESDAGVVNVTGMMEHLETGENRRNDHRSVSNGHEDSLSPGEPNQQRAEIAGMTEDSVQAPCAASSASN